MPVADWSNPPSISGTPALGQLLTCNEGSWSNSPTSYTYTWYRGMSGMPIASTKTYTVVEADQGQKLMCMVGASNGDGRSFSSVGSNQVDVAIPANSPVATTPPTITGVARVGRTLTCVDGTWTNNPTTIAYEWLQWGNPIMGATSSTLALTTAHLSSGASLTCRITRSNTTWATSATSAGTAVLPSETAPVNHALPTITGTLQVGSQLTCDPGTWTGTPTPTFSYSWSDGRGTSSTYTPVNADAGLDIHCSVTATNTGGTESENSASVTVPRPATWPSNTVAPTLTGTPTVGSTLTCGTGTWSSTPPAPSTYVYAWYTWDSWGDGETIPDETTSTLVLDASHQGTNISCEVTATNGSGSGTASSLSREVFAAAGAPQPVARVTITGNPEPGNTLTCNPGTWNPVEADIAFSWTGGNAWGTTTATYTVQPWDTFETLECTVTGSNEFGSASMTAAIEIDGMAEPEPAPGSPQNTVDPTISGTARVGETITCNPGTWTGSPTPTYTYRWMTNDGTVIGNTLTLSPTLQNTWVTCEVRATNSNGSDTDYAGSWVATALTAPTNSTPPTVTGTMAAGELLQCSPGTWTGSPSYSYAWTRDGETLFVSTSTYLVSVLDQGSVIGCRVTARNATGYATVESSSRAVPLPLTAPAVLTPPQVTGTPQAGQTLTCTQGTWTQSPTQYTYSWMTSGSETPTGPTYTATAEDVGSTVSCMVRAANASWATTAESNSVLIAAGANPPVATGAPDVSGTRSPGQLLTCSNASLSWSNSPTSFTYAWEVDGNQVGSSSENFQVTWAHQGSSIRCSITAANTHGSDRAESAEVEIPVPGGAPVNQVPPSISGTVRVNELLTCNSGTWTNAPTLSVEWLIWGMVVARTATYTPTLESQGDFLSCRVTASTAVWEEQLSTVSQEIEPGANAPVSSSPVVISHDGTPAVGETLTCTGGGWSNSPQVTYTWWSSSSEPIDTTTATFVVRPSDDDEYVLCSMRASNADGTAWADSSSVLIGGALLAPANTSPVTISAPGTITTGSTLTCDEGSWDPAGDTYTFAWLRDGGVIGGETGTDHVVVTADRGTTITCRVSATNGTGTTMSTSTGVAIPALAPPVNTVVPTASGSDLTLGGVLTCVEGTWSPTADTYTYTWRRNGAPISLATSRTYAITAADQGTMVSCVVVGINEDGSSLDVASAERSVPAAAGAPSSTALPQITGTVAVGSTVTCTDGTWDEAPTSYSRIWRNNGIAIAGQTAATYVVQSGDTGDTLTCVVTATNASGSSSATSAAVVVPVPVLAPVLAVAPVVTGATAIGSVLTCTVGSWTNTPTSFDRLWLRNGASLGVTTPTYTTQAADGGTTITCRVIASNAGGASAAATSNGIAVVAPSPTPDPTPPTPDPTPPPVVDPVVTPTDTTPPRATVLKPTPKSCKVTQKTRTCTIRGSVVDAGVSSGIRMVQVNVTRPAPRRQCAAWTGLTWKTMTCAKAKKVFVKAKVVGTTWSIVVKLIVPKQAVTVTSKATDVAGLPQAKPVVLAMTFS